MAKTWTVAEAYNAIKAGDKDGIADFGKRFPLATTALAQAGTNTGLDMFFNALPDRVTMRVVEMSLKEGVQPVEDDEEVEAPVKAEKKEKATKTEKAPAKKGRAKKEEVIEEEDDDDEDEIEEEEIVEDDETVDYSSMSVIELFKECKKRKIKVEPKQKASVYIKALEADDAKNTEADGEDEDWDEEEEEKPSKKSAKSAKAPAKSAKKSKNDDDDEEWDI